MNTVHTERRTVVVAAHLTPADQVAFGDADARRVPSVGERANEVVSGLGERWLDAFVRIEDRAPRRLVGPPSRGGTS